MSTIRTQADVTFTLVRSLMNLALSKVVVGPDARRDGSRRGQLRLVACRSMDTGVSHGGKAPPIFGCRSASQRVRQRNRFNRAGRVERITLRQRDAISTATAGRYSWQYPSGVRRGPNYAEL